ncbi:hypothetical protein K474DRAFT_1041315 [Panus rudis PR-1116 ss-1]|nr:hypothetical protein K474DRAFT_1041315 [Panus rudis PR-1116 ss-1]
MVTSHWYLNTEGSLKSKCELETPTLPYGYRSLLENCEVLSTNDLKVATALIHHCTIRWNTLRIVPAQRCCAILSLMTLTRPDSGIFAISMDGISSQSFLIHLSHSASSSCHSSALTKTEHTTAV